MTRSISIVAFAAFAIAACSSSSARVAPVSQAADRSLASECQSATDALSVSSQKVAEPSDAGLVLIANTAVRPGEEPLEKPALTTFAGKCAPLLKAAVFGALRLSNGAIYRHENDRIVPWPSDEDPSILFDDRGLTASEIPAIPDAEFIDAAYIESGRGDNGVTKHYVGVWKRPTDWLLAEFIIPPDKSQTTSVRPLLTSRYPLKSVSFFPSPDTNSGGLDMVQDAPSGPPRVIAFRWWHGSLHIRDAAKPNS